MALDYEGQTEWVMSENARQLERGFQIPIVRVQDDNGAE